jgi:hypothetical protein
MPSRMMIRPPFASAINQPLRYQNSNAVPNPSLAHSVHLFPLSFALLATAPHRDISALRLIGGFSYMLLCFQTIVATWVL